MTNQSSTPAAPSTSTPDPEIEILPALPDGEEWQGVPEDITLPKQLEFEPVVLRGGRNGVTAMKQRVFIRVLAETGRVSLAAKATGNVLGSFYYLRNQPQGKSFARAWARALDFGVGRVLDILVDHAVNGTPEYIYQNGELVGEKRSFDHRLMMWLVAHNQPEKYAVAGGLMHAVHSGAAGAARMKLLKREWTHEYQEKLAKWNRPQDPEEIKEEIIRKVNAMNRPRMIAIANDPEKRAAWELINGPQDWSEFERR